MTTDEALRQFAESLQQVATQVAELATVEQQAAYLRAIERDRLAREKQTVTAEAVFNAIAEGDFNGVEFVRNYLSDLDWDTIADVLPSDYIERQIAQAVEDGDFEWDDLIRNNKGRLIEELARHGYTPDVETVREALDAAKDRIEDALSALES